MKLSGQCLGWKKIGKGFRGKGVHYQRKVIWEFHNVRIGLASVGLGCQRSWNELCK